MNNLNSEETLWVILPILVVVALLVASIIILPKTQTNLNSKASTPTTTPTKAVVATPTKPAAPEIICSSLYSPVCSYSGITFANECEANQAGVTAFIKGECTANSTILVTPAPEVIPETN